MPNKKSKLIAFDDLERFIIKPGFCTMCGACEAACPVHAIKVEDEKPVRLHDCSEHLDSCPICYDICPHTDELLFETLRFVADAPHRRENLGHYRKILLAHSTNPTLRDASRSGGVVNALLNFAIGRKIIDSAIVSEASSRVPIKVRPSINLVPDDTLSAVDTKIVPSAVAEAFGRAAFEHGKVHIAFVGVPCHILALRKLEAWQHKLMDSLEITIGLFCLWTFSLGRLLEYLLQEHKIAANEIQHVDLTVNEYVVTAENRVVRIPIAEVESHIMNRCRTCTDFTSELADLSIGGASPLEDWSIVIIRTKKGEDFLNRAIKEGIITTKEIDTEPEPLAHLIQLSAHKRNAALNEIEAMQRANIPIPTAAKFSAGPIASEISTLKEVKVGEVMTKKVVTLTPSMTVNELLDEIAKHHHIGFPIMSESNKIVGIITLQDAMKVDKEKRNSVLLDEICTKSLVVVFPEDSVIEAFEKMSKYNVGRLLVVHKRDKRTLLGILTRSDVMHALRKHFRQLIIE
ncbi:MAG: Coenzyme F420 hydrogenase/dehydrogenase, beta subunit C-terminal domain [Candidatus Bathyarchaeota archaeon]|nr:Coenzyme F420 hydrogenase/dehydrogenase, beta subunit C-terminal domain [Candidatus Bathyarchaeota archaeon]MDH5788691.1 Coenzyme F420 hydrogenase/dehydrogenase, beta subunit C-terminal domain [Candidatus Bathyarchaeota archaeon]